MYRINESAEQFSLSALSKFTEVSTLDSDWLSALEHWASDPDMVVVLTGAPLETALGEAKEGYTPRMACAVMVLRYLRELSSSNLAPRDGTPNGHWLLTDSKMVCEIVDNKLWVWHKVK